MHPTQPPTAQQASGAHPVLHWAGWSSPGYTRQQQQGCVIAVNSKPRICQWHYMHVVIDLSSLGICRQAGRSAQRLSANSSQSAPEAAAYSRPDHKQICRTYRLLLLFFQLLCCKL
jgi:hypothetical protein